MDKDKVGCGNTNDCYGNGISTQTEPVEGSCCNDSDNINHNRMDKMTIKQLNYGYIVSVGCQTLAIDSQVKLIKWMTEYIQNPMAVRKKWYDGYYHFTKVIEKFVGVISEDIDDFNLFKNKLLNVVDIPNSNEFVIHQLNSDGDVENIIYKPIYTVNNVLDFEFYKVIVANGDEVHKQYEEIMEKVKIS